MKPTHDRPAARAARELPEGEDAVSQSGNGTLADSTWSGDRAVGCDHAARRLAGSGVDGPDPADFGVVWANMRRGHRAGELRALPRLTDAFDDWLAESRLQAGIGADPGLVR